MLITHAVDHGDERDTSCPSAVVATCSSRSGGPRVHAANGCKAAPVAAKGRAFRSLARARSALRPAPRRPSLRRMTARIFARVAAASLAGLVLLGAEACKREPPQPMTADGALPSLQPQELAHRLSERGEKPLLFHVGFKKLYEQAHIPGSEFLGPTSDADGLDRLRQRVAELPRTREIVVYCGCCPWERCPNVKPASELLRDLGFTNARALFVPHDLGRDWVDQGYPVAKGN